MKNQKNTAPQTLKSRKRNLKDLELKTIKGGTNKDGSGEKPIID